MRKFFVGIDISKSWFDVSYWEKGTAKYLGRLDNQIKGFKKLRSKLKRETKVSQCQWFVCFENTGVYSKSLLHWLLDQSIPCREECPIRISRSLGLRRGKDDKADSRDICRYAYEKRDSIECTKPKASAIIRLRKLLTRRDLLKRQKQALAVSLGEQKKILPKDLLDMYVTQNEELIQLYCTQIEWLEEQIQLTIEMDEEMNKNNQLASSVIGIGPVISAYIIAFTDNYTSITSGRKFATYVGIAPFPNRSGIKNGKTRVSHMANKKIKALLSNGVFSAIGCDSGLKAYHQRKVKEGKEKGVVINALKNKLVHRVFAVIKRQQPYIEFNYV